MDTTIPTAEQLKSQISLEEKELFFSPTGAIVNDEVVKEYVENAYLKVFQKALATKSRSIELTLWNEDYNDKRDLWISGCVPTLKAQVKYFEKLGYRVTEIDDLFDAKKYRLEF